MEYDWMVNSGMVTMGNDGLRLTLNETNGELVHPELRSALNRGGEHVEGEFC